MRLSSHACEVIRQAVAEQFGEQAQVRVFGSRLDDSARGGDIDLHVSTGSAVDNPGWLSSLLAAKLQRRLDGRRVDIRLLAAGVAPQAIDRLALRQGLQL